ncbi:MAG: 16S rRNA (adenine(1518)-N(6)/adenine(1519)-N(6))-dimethyltransferase RsmA, partial [Candidatus Anammoxibacter sp.]
VTWLKSALSKNGIRPNKRFGQNFLIDQNLLAFLIKAGQLDKDDIVLEIGPGTGTLTQMLAEYARSVVAVEIDKGLFEFVKENVGLPANVTLLNRDVLKSKSQLEPTVISTIEDLVNSYEHSQEHDKNKNATNLKVISNLPYNISTSVIINLLESDLPITLMILTLQKDITNRLSAKPGTKDYGILSIIAQYFAKIEVLKKLPPSVFWPTPKVESAIIQLQIYKKENIKPITDYSLFQKVLKAIFTTRRKTIYNSLTKLDIPFINRDVLMYVLKETGIDTGSRGEALSVEQIIELTNNISTRSDSLPERY